MEHLMRMRVQPDVAAFALADTGGRRFSTRARF
jgi:hypothetical protein